MITQWIDWLALVTNGLWIVSLSALIAIASFGLFMKMITRRLILLAWTFGFFCCLGLVFSLPMLSQKLAFAFVGVLCVCKLIVLFRTRR